MAAPTLAECKRFLGISGDTRDAEIENGRTANERIIRAESTLADDDEFPDALGFAYLNNLQSLIDDRRPHPLLRTYMGSNYTRALISTVDDD